MATSKHALPKFETVLYDRKGAICYITLNRPEKLNAASDQLVEEVNDALFEFDADETLQVAILTGAGRAFCSGADVRQRQLRSPEELRRLGGPAGRRSRAHEPPVAPGVRRASHARRRAARLVRSRPRRRLVELLRDRRIDLAGPRARGERRRAVALATDVSRETEVRSAVERAVASLIGQIEGVPPRPVVIDIPQIVVRESSGPVRDAAKS